MGNEDILGKCPRCGHDAKREIGYETIFRCTNKECQFVDNNKYFLDVRC